MDKGTTPPEAIRRENGYSLSHEQVLQLTAELLEERPPASDDRFVCYKLDGNDRFSDIGRHLECRVFDEEFGNDPAEMTREYQPYEQQSEFLISVDQEAKVPTGVLRVIKNGPAGLKTLNDLENPQDGTAPIITANEAIAQHGIDLDKCWDIGTVAIPKEYRSKAGAVSVMLYRGTFLAAREQGIEHVVSIVDSKPLQKMTGYLGIPFVPLAGTKPMSYLGSESSQPVYGYLPDFYKKMNRNRFTLKGMLAYSVLRRLVKGTGDSEYQFDSPYKK